MPECLLSKPLRKISTKRKSAARESTARKSTTSLEFETSSATLLEHKSLSTSTAERRALERLSAMPARGIVRIVTMVEALPQLGIRQHLVRLVDRGHLLLRFLF